MATDDSNPWWSKRDRALVRTVTELLDSGEYERLAELLERERTACEQEGDALPAHTLDLARRICLACGQSQAEAAWHQQARKEAAQREDELRGQLDTLLDLAGGTAPIPDAPAPPEPVEPLSLWQRIQGILHGRVGQLPSGEVVSEAPVQGSTSPRLGRVEGRARSPTEEAETPSPSPAQVADAQPSSPSQAMAAADSSLPGSKRKEDMIPPAGREKAEEPGPPSLVVYCLGPFRVYQDDQPVYDWPSSRGKAIFKYLVTHRERPVVKEVLMELFWPGAHPDAARNNLNVAIYGLRQALRRTRPSYSHVLFQDDCYLLNPDLRIWVDTEEFTAHCRDAEEMNQRGDQVAATREYHAAETLYEGEFLEEDRYEDWPIPPRQRLRDSFRGALNHLSRFYLDQGDFIACVSVCRKMLAVDPCCEEAHRRLMRCYSRLGQHFLAMRQYHLCVETLAEELDLAPAPSTAQLYDRIRSHDGT